MFTSLRYEETSVQSGVSVAWHNPHRQNHCCQLGGDDKWKTTIQTSGYCHKTSYQSQNRPKAENLSLGPKLSILTKKKKFICQQALDSQVSTSVFDEWKRGEKPAGFTDIWTNCRVDMWTIFLSEWIFKIFNILFIKNAFYASKTTRNYTNKCHSQHNGLL